MSLEVENGHEEKSLGANGQGVGKKFSVGICVSDSASNLGRLMSVIEGESFPEGHSLEKVIIVASGCDTATLAFLRNLSDSDRRVALIEEPRRYGKAAAINKIPLSLARLIASNMACENPPPPQLLLIT